MKICRFFFVIVCVALLSACKSVALNIVPTATITPTSIWTSKPTFTVTPSRTPTITYTPSPSRTPKDTLTPTASITARPTPTSPYPVGPKTPLPPGDFSVIGTENISKLAPVFGITQQSIWQNALSRDGKKLFVAANNGLFVYNRQGGQQLSYWPSLILPSLPCETCLSINTDGSRFAVATHKDGKWFVQVYNVYEDSANLLLEKPIEAPVQGIVNEARVALSPDGLLLAYGAGDSDTLLIDMNSNQTLLTNKGGADAVIFSPTGTYLIIRRAREMLFWKTSIWKNPTSLQLPAADSAYAFSPDGKLLAVALPDKIRAYLLDTLKPTREISIPTPKGINRAWKIAFIDEKTLAGYNTLWDSANAKATVDIGLWDMETGLTLQMATSETDSPDVLSALWRVVVPLAKAQGPVALGQYSTFRFVDQDQLQVNSLHNACWLKLSSGETTCFNDPKFTVFSSQTEAYRVVRQEQTTLLQGWNGSELFKLPEPYPILGMNWTAEYFIINVKNATTDVYFKGRKPPLGSFPGTLLAYAENADRLAYSTRQANSTSGFITMLNKKTLETTYQKKVDFIMKPLAIGGDNRVYFVQRDVGQQKFAVKAISGITGAITDVSLLSLPADPEALSISMAGVFAFGLRDGSVAIVSSDGLQIASFQAVYTPISAISITPDGRYLAVASDDGIRVFAVLP